MQAFLQNDVKGNIMQTKSKFLFVFTALTMLCLTSCNFGSPKDQLLEDIKNAPVETDETILDHVIVRNADTGVYGNIYLPEEVNGATITWWSSDRNTIYQKKVMLLRRSY